MPKGFQLRQQTAARAHGPEVSSEPSDESYSATGTPEQEGEPGLHRPHHPSQPSQHWPLAPMLQELMLVTLAGFRNLHECI